MASRDDWPFVQRFPQYAAYAPSWRVDEQEPRRPSLSRPRERTFPFVEDHRSKQSLHFVLDDDGPKRDQVSRLGPWRHLDDSSTDSDSPAVRPSFLRPSESREWSQQETTTRGVTRTGGSTTIRGSTTTPASKKASEKAKAKAPATKRAKTYDEKRLARKCTVAECTNYTINRGLCFRHGGGKKCSLEGCTASAKVGGLCWKHGGSVQCVVDGCKRRGKSRGYCWTHGGGTECQHDGCAKVAVSKGFCWAHGGGKRCQFDGCMRPAYERTFNYCTKHFKRFENGDEVMEV